ncbi:MAG TPA: CHRD domain-containing protein [Noviherbaspirillum sp.]|uniref:CHRD domain-containing protein n=1 Tax=Noviherbaspirillum sp. TaxID=1926288 RepID=UPI002D59DAA3|nr:CHRD domain-containing protein [Noviherbaspirillum sp.]HYD96300.1 CHRD domain-containing protein [Noviherbaspirillum sp.]
MASFRLPAWQAVLFSVCVLAACGGSDDDAPYAFSAALGGTQQLPAASTGLSGSGVVTVEPDGSALTASVILNAPVAGTVHLHEAPSGAVGPAVFTLEKVPGANAWTTRAALSEAQFAALRAGNYYFDVHTAGFPNGEIRGQVIWVMPAVEQIVLLQQVRGLSPAVELQLQQLQEIEDYEEGHFTGVGLGLTLGF